MNEEPTENLNFISLLKEFRAVGEFSSFVRHSWTWPLVKQPEHGRQILLIPGFLAGDATLYPFANWLRSRGHHVFFSGIMANADCPQHAMTRLQRILRDLHKHSEEKVVVIGHSLGGIYARELARRMPECIDQVILLGSPIKEPLRYSNPFVKMLATVTRHVQEASHGCSGDMATICGVNADEPPPGVPETLVYSRRDGVVNWHGCVEHGPGVSAFEVDSTHCGLPYNDDTMRIVRQKIEGTAAA